MKRSVLTVTLNPALDRTITVKNFQLNKISLVENESISAGGKGLNVSRALNRLGVESIATGLLGGDSGMSIKRLLKEEGFLSRFIDISGDSRTNLTIINKGNPYKGTRIFGPGPEIKRKDAVRFKRKFKALLKISDFVVLSGSSPSKASDGLYAELIKLSKRAHVQVLLDTSGNSLVKGVEACPFIIKPNKEELEGLFKIELNSLSSIKNSILNLHQKGIRIVLLTLGFKGAIGSDGLEMWAVRPSRVKIVNDVGCGDSFNAGFLSSYFKGRSFDQCLRTAVAAGTANAISLIPGSISKRGLMEASKIIKLKRL